MAPKQGLPDAPSMRGDRLNDSGVSNDEKEFVEDDLEVVAVFNANSPDGKSMVKALSEGGSNVVAIVRVFTSKHTQSLLNLPRVTVRVADSLDENDVQKALQGVQRAFLCLKYWEKFESEYEESQAYMVLRACATNGVKRVVFSTFEDTKQLRQQNRKSQIVPDANRKVHPKFEGMKDVKKEAKKMGVDLTHMITSFLDKETSKGSLCLLVGSNGKLIVKPNLKE
eukprot:CAMPEP_0202463966 /NCGR_PEP_ID=MMETSP1360-20130828/60157_1 /ASSEMBLY_ACC=CAM_ASM_000848 /TAXON_ID=515479 /ORGANISM="Licmophora paradoxa, Strain CCMP2313" /LENGTH=224 /DNA_ID=CAMNT_0049087061 /DNA_START=111 /DNA_END=785 /DNA_ORIENTATION=+